MRGTIRWYGCNKRKPEWFPIFGIIVTIVVTILTVTFVLTYEKDDVLPERIAYPSALVIVLQTPAYEVDSPIFIREDTSLSDSEPFSAEEVEAIALTLAGECYDDKLEDKRGVAEVIVNRVSEGSFGDSVIDVLTSEGQFCGYWNQGRPVSESDIQVAEETLNDWYSNGCEALSDYLYFCSGPGRENIFRVEF